MADRTPEESLEKLAWLELLLSNGRVSSANNIRRPDNPSAFEKEVITECAGYFQTDPALFTYAANMVDAELSPSGRKRWARSIKVETKRLERAQGDDIAEVEEALRRRGVPIFCNGTEAELASELLRQIEPEVHGVLVEMVYDLGRLHTYHEDSGTWCSIEDSELSTVIQAWDGTLIRSRGQKPQYLKLSRTKVHGAIQLAKELRSQEGTPNKRGFFDAAPPGVAFKDYFVKLDESRQVSFDPHSPEHRCLWSLEFDIKQELGEYQNSRWSEFIEEVFDGDDDAQEKYDVLQEFIGGALLGVSTKFQQCIALLGEGSNGKSVFLKVISELFPTHAISSIAPQRMTNDFTKAALEGKHLNVVNELPEQSILASEDFKAVIDGNSFTASHKYEQVRTFRTKAGHIFSANRLPSVKDTSHGFWRRWIVITFNRIFSKDEQDENLVDFIVTNELPAVAAWAIEGAVRLLEQHNYTQPNSSTKAKDEWKIQSNNVALWIEERCEKNFSAEHPGTPIDELYSDYKLWCEEGGFKACTKQTFGQRINALGHDGKQRRFEGKQKRAKRLRLLRDLEKPRFGLS